MGPKGAWILADHRCRWETGKELPHDGYSSSSHGGHSQFSASTPGYWSGFYGK